MLHFPLILLTFRVYEGGFVHIIHIVHNISGGQVLLYDLHFSLILQRFLNTCRFVHIIHSFHNFLETLAPGRRTFFFGIL